MTHADEEWRCSWCDRPATEPGRTEGICESRRCGCGALGIAAPPWDRDEIIDDAINVFGIPAAYMTEFDADRLAGLQQSGVEVAEGAEQPPDARHRFPRAVLWFRRRRPSG